MPGPWGVLVVDDSELSRDALRGVIQLEPQLKVVAEARTGEEAVDWVRRLKPHLVTMDLNMPGMGGLKAIEAIMRERPTPIVVISERTSTAGFDVNYEAISRGALELVPKSQVFGTGPDGAAEFAQRLMALAAAGLEADERHAAPVPAALPPLTEPLALVGIGASTGGPKAVAKLLGELPHPFPLPIALVQHMAEDFFDSYVRYLRDASGHAVEEARNGVRLEAGRVYVAPSRQEMFVREDLTVRLAAPPANALISPSVDSLFFSMASAVKARGLGVILTGMGDDGAQGLLRMRRTGARTVAQDRASSAVFGMPKAAIEVGAVELTLGLERIAAVVTHYARGGPGKAPAPSLAAIREVKDDRPIREERKDERKRILVVDEHGAADQVTRKTLESAGYEVELVDNPMLVAKALRKRPADLVLLDPELTAMSGAALIETLRKHTQLNVPVFLLSSLDAAALRAKVKQCAAQGAVRRGATELLREVNAFLGGPRRPLS